MAEIKEFTKINMAQMRKRLEVALAEVEKETGVKFDIGNIRFSNDHFHTKISGNIPGAAGEEIPNATLILGLPPTFKTMIGKTFVTQGYTFTVERYDSAKRKYPVICKRNDGKNFKFTVDSVMQFLNGEK